jgi:hypothetical protein
VKYQITVKIADKTTAGTADPQFVKIKGTKGSTDELKCNADFNVNNKDVTCTVESTADIGHYDCISWRTGGNDEWNFSEVILIRQMVIAVKAFF